MKATILFIIACSLTLATFGQESKLKKANSYFDHLSYAYAADLYKDLTGTKYDSPQVQANLAFCYLKMEELNKSAETYAEMINSSETTSEDYYNYAYVLKRLGNYAESDQWMNKFAKQELSDSRAKMFLENKGYKSYIESINPFFSIKNLEINSKFDDFGGYYNKSENKLYFVSSRSEKAFVKNEWGWNEGSFLDIFVADINSAREASNPKEVTKLNTKFHEGPLTFSPDGKKVYYTRNNISSGKERFDENSIQNLKLYISDVDGEGKFSNEREFTHNSKEYSVGHPTITKDGKTMYVISDMPGGYGGADLYRVEIRSDGSFGPMINLGPEINTAGQEMFPYVAEDGKLFFSSDGLPGLGGFDVYVAAINSKGEVGGIQNLGTPVNTRFDDFALTLANDGQTGFFTSSRDGGQGGDDIYGINLLRPITIDIKIKGQAKDNEGNPVTNATITLKDKNGKVVQTIQSDDEGNYTFMADRDSNYELLGTKEGYFDGTKSVNTNSEDPVVFADLLMEKDPGIALYIIVTDWKTGNPVEGVNIQVIDELKNITKNVKTPPTGDVLLPLADKVPGDKGQFILNLEKADYVPESINYDTIFKEKGLYEIHIKMTKISDSNIELLQINPIYFDLDKSNIRSDAKKELDKIVELMNKYPDLVIELGSHTDCRATKAYNERLATKRANATTNYIKKKISNPSRIYGKGYGEYRLLNNCECEGDVKSDCSETEHAKNRRTEFRIISGADKVRIINNSPNSFDK